MKSVRLPLVWILIVLTALVWRDHVQSAGPHSTIPAGTLIREISLAVREEHPRLLRLERTFTDPAPGEPMYFVHLAGHFQRGSIRADELFFSALADRRYIWGVAGYAGRSKQRHNVWSLCQRPCRGVLR